MLVTKTDLKGGVKRMSPFVYAANPLLCSWKAATQTKKKTFLHVNLVNAVWKKGILYHVLTLL